MPSTFLLYGATGYTGSLTAHTAVQRGLKPILAGRDAAKVKALADEFGPRVARLSAGGWRGAQPGTP